MSQAAGIVGTIAGDDTVLVIAADEAGGAEVVTRMLALAGRTDDRLTTDTAPTAQEPQS